MIAVINSSWPTPICLNINGNFYNLPAVHANANGAVVPTTVRIQTADFAALSNLDPADHRAVMLRQLRTLDLGEPVVAGGNLDPAKEAELKTLLSSLVWRPRHGLV